jgi:hypothetical protein
LLTRELIMHAEMASQKGRSLRSWDTLARIMNLLKAATEAINGAHIGPDNIGAKAVVLLDARRKGKPAHLDEL